MAVRLKTKWHRSKRSQRNMEGSKREKTMTDLAGVIAFNIWKLAKEIYTNMEKEEFLLGSDKAVIDILTEIIAFMIQVADRMVYGKLSEEERREFITVMAKQLADMINSNMNDLIGEGEYGQAFIDTLNSRFGEYAECVFVNDEPGFDFRRLLGKHVSDIMAGTDNRWVVEHVMDVEVPNALKKLQRLITDVMGLRKRTVKQPDAE
ncbi:hypothetical protein [Sulfuriflexus mobilis]|uniref:hypothetical protein n=1 Tax=Sulfuriflexus mobilis TaxID=1811807 RepID=UPI000F83C1F7|nr:hypothetical protein [Sulfuriflexus mobilis]